MEPYIGIVIWLVLGYIFTVWFVNYFLDDKTFSDQYEPVGPGTLILLTLAGPAMALVMLVLYIIYVIGIHAGTTIQRAYGVRR